MIKRTILLLAVCTLLGIVVWRATVDKPAKQVKTGTSPVTDKAPPISPGRTPLAATAQTNRRGNEAVNVGQPGIVKDQQDRLAPFLRHSIEKPELSALLAITQDDLPALTVYYQAHTNLMDRNLVIQALGLVGNDATAEMLARALTQEFNGRTLLADEAPASLREEFVMENTVHSLGFLAQRSVTAWNLVRDGIDPQFWKFNTQWESTSGADKFGILAGESIKAVAMSGRPEAENILKSLKGSSLRNDVDPDPSARRLDGALMDAAFFYSVISTDGKDEFLKWYFRPAMDVPETGGRRARWLASRDGKEWQSWYAERNAVRNP